MQTNALIGSRNTNWISKRLNYSEGMPSPIVSGAEGNWVLLPVDLIESEHEYVSETPAFDILWRERMMVSGKVAEIAVAKADSLYRLGNDLTTDTVST